MSMNMKDRIRHHYETPDGNAEGVARVIAKLDAMTEEPLTPQRLAALDQFHVRGLAATKELAELAGIDASMHVLDAGSGIGGPARFLAGTYGCTVNGIDITPSFVELAELITERMELADKVSYEVGDLLALPYPGDHFDIVWTVHVVMNIRDREQVYREFRRVLKPNGKLVFFDLFAPDHKPELPFPQPWAETSDESFMMTQAETVAALTSAGFNAGVWNDVTEEAQTALVSGQAPVPTPDALSLGTLIGPRFGQMFANIRSSIHHGYLRTAMGSYHTEN